MTITIKHRHTGEILFTSGKGTMRDALVEAVAARADLTGADLTGAYLSVAYLTDANLTDAYLTDANLTRANLTDANLTDADLTDADLTRAYLADADLAGLPYLGNLDQAILTAIETAQAAGHDGLDMADWHTCDTTHCIAGWAVHLSGDAGARLEAQVGSAAAGALIYARHGCASIPDFYEADTVALQHLRERAAAFVAPETGETR